MLAILSLVLLWGTALAHQNPDALSEDENARRVFREASISSCEERARESTTPELEGLNWPRLCRCATDRIIEGKSAQHLAEMVPRGPGQREAVVQCLAEMKADGEPPWSEESR